MMMLVLSALVLLLVTAPAHAADPPKVPTATQSQGPGPAIQSDAVKPLTQPNVVTPPTAKPVPPPAPPASGPGVSGPKAGPGAPAAGPTVPTIPAAGTPGIDPKLGSTIRDANQMDAIRDLKQLEQLNRDPLQRGRPAGQSEGLPQTLGRGQLGAPSDHQRPAGFGRDCVNNPVSCLGRGARDRFGSAPGGGLGGPPTLGGALGNPGAAASGDGGEGPNVRQRADAKLGANTSVQVSSTHTDSETTTTQSGEDYENGTRTATHTEDQNGNGELDEEFSFKDGSRTHINDRTDADQGTAHYHSETDGNGNGGWYMVIREPDGRVLTEQKGSIVGGRHVFASGGPDSQPREDPNAGTGRNDGCNWAPIHGCLNPREDIRTTIRQQTTQPGINPDGQGTEGGTGSSRGGSTGPEAVTNTGDGSFGVQRSGNSGHGTPIWQTMPDPARGGPGGPAPGSPAGRAGSDAGLDASLGAVPPPPPPR